MSSALIFVLHAHLPYVRQPSPQSSIEELWFLEAMWETYLPLLNLLQKYHEKKAAPFITLSISPPLAEMMSDPLMNEKFRSHMQAMEALALAEADRTHGSEFQKSALMYLEKIRSANNVYKSCGGNILSAIKQLSSAGVVELIATSATHAFLPAYQGSSDALKCQIRVGINYYEKMFGKRPKGFWLPECGYFEGLDHILSAQGIEYFFVEGHGLINGCPTPKCSVHKHVVSPSGVAVFGRDMNTCGRVWSAESGYPGASAYRDFYRDVGFDLSASYLAGFFHDFGAKVFMGLKYYSIAESQGVKIPYDRQKAAIQAEYHAAGFVADLAENFKELSGYCESPVIVAAFDAELFGHWWFEGIEWLDNVVAKVSEGSRGFSLSTPSAYLAESAKCIQKIEPSTSSWGEGGYNSCWINEGSSRFYGRLERMPEMIKRLESMNNEPELLKAALDQAFREMLLAQSSDWFFLMNKDRSGEYALNRLTTHIKNFEYIVEGAINNHLDKRALQQIEKNSPFIKDISAMT
ncbi:MAG: DUF1957 domain-containing protein [Nitrospirae bacterium]|nr:DUF1957 domain-containing protein [Nitrospirota bacterium]